ncbi:helix-turn-helix transcriptional regulator [Paraburkholderia sediminicola]|uniref:helix-turn-helix domain-containing protein n=1 Tax=Paraburkholderia sediminicola TaxID=458836 RepID=UPI0038BA54D3
MEERVKMLGLALRQLRQAKGLSQEELAERAGLHRNFVGLVERGATKIAIDSLFCLADALGVSASDLLRQAETRPSSKAE